MMEKHPKYILFYDGGCGLCHFAVQWVALRDEKKRIFFAPLEGETAKKLLPKDLPDTLVFYEDGKITFFGEGAFRVASYLSSPWKILGIFSHLPTFLINPLYRLVARHRSGLFSPPHSINPPSIDPSRFLP